MHILLVGDQGSWMEQAMVEPGHSYVFIRDNSLLLAELNNKNTDFDLIVTADETDIQKILIWLAADVRHELPLIVFSDETGLKGEIERLGGIMVSKEKTIPSIIRIVKNIESS